MKYSVVFTVVFALLMFLSPAAKSQVKVDVKGKVNNEADNRANRGTDRVIDAGFDKLEEGIKGVIKKKDKKGKETGNSEDDEITAENDEKDEEAKSDAKDTRKVQTDKSIKGASQVLSWSKYDFVPGDQVIFEDNLQKEDNGEFPSRWDLNSGNAEVAELDGEKVIMLRDGNPQIVPYFKDPGEDHLPDVFTIEFDLLYKGEYPFEIMLYDRKNQQNPSPTGYSYITVSGNQMSMGTAQVNIPTKIKILTSGDISQLLILTEN